MGRGVEEKRKPLGGRDKEKRREEKKRRMRGGKRRRREEQTPKRNQLGEGEKVPKSGEREGLVG